MRTSGWLIAVLAFGTQLFVGSETASAADISGTISSTRTITEDSQLVGNVTCTVTGAACLTFGASGIALRLNGFSITGQANPDTGCGGAFTQGEGGINVDNQRGVIIQGPGVVQRFRANGIRLLNSSRVLVTRVTMSTNCLSGIIVQTGASDNVLDANIIVRNGTATVATGGIWLLNASRNQVRGNLVTGNGYAAQGSNFGIGLVDPNDGDNVIADNTVVGNANGIVMVAGAVGNLISGNFVVGNPPVQVAVNNPDSTGVDIRNLTAPGSNAVDGNVCLTAVNALCSQVTAAASRGRAAAAR
jgi:parallel beta-helix repeat protein